MMLLLSVMLLDRASYFITAGIVLLAVAALGIAERHGLTRTVPRVRSLTTYDSIFFVDLNRLVFAIIGSRIARDAQRNVSDLRATIARVSKGNLELSETADALTESQQQLDSIYNAVQDVLFYLAVEPEGRFRFVSVNAAFLKVTGLSREAVIGGQSMTKCGADSELPYQYARASSPAAMITSSEVLSLQYFGRGATVPLGSA
jgi:PAS domain-containing protein